VGWLGHYDLTDSMSIPGQFEHPRFKAAVKSLLTACEKCGKSAGFLATDMKQAIAWKKKGFRCLGYGTDIGLLRDSLSSGLVQLKALE
jgi:2-dehydro-3-deoxyglucarate aldolase/4-hydroxy-2-oxoheptanedioate aldolase